MTQFGSMANPLINGASGGYDMGYATTEARRQPGGSDAGPPIGSGALTGSHNTPLHCSALILIALAGVFFLYWGGFRFAFDVGMGRS